MKLLETIRFENDGFENLDYHQHRMNRSRKMLFRREDEIDLNKYFFKSSFRITNPEERINELSSSGFAIPMQGKQYIVKCRIIYTEQIEKTEFLPYQRPKIRTLKIVADDEIDYLHKFLDRKPIEKLVAKKGGCDDILIVKNGLITDTSFANILFFNGKEWITPALPLLKGTQRARLLDEEKIRPADIRPEDLRYFRKARLINAMICFGDEVDIPVENIKP